MHRMGYEVSDSDSEEESKVLAKVDLVPGDSRVITQPLWTRVYREQTEREKIHSKYLASFTPVLSVELEDSLWEEVASKKISVTKLEPPSVLEVKTRIPANKKKWYFDDSDDDIEEETKENRALDQTSRQEAARSVGRSLLSDTWGDDSDEDEVGVEGKIANRRSSTGSSQSRHGRTSPPPLLQEEEEEENENVRPRSDEVDSTFKHAVDDMFDATMCGDQGALEEVVDALSTMEIPFEEKLEAGKRVVDLMDEDGNTCLMISCELGHYEVASYLLKKARCSLEVANHSGLTALHLASMFGKLECVQLLVNHAGKGKQSLEGISLFLFRGHPFRDKTAVAMGETEVLPTYERPMITPTNASGSSSSSADVSASEAKSRTSNRDSRLTKFAPCNGTALYWAAARGHLSVVKFLAGMYKPLMDESHTAENDSPLWMALYHRHREVAKFLVEHGADAVATNSAGINILGVMRIRKMEDQELVSVIKDAISKRKIRELHRRRDAEQAESRRWLAGQGEPEPGTGVAIFLVSIPDKRKSTFKRRIALDMPVRFLFEAVDIHMSDKCGLDLLHGFELHTTTKVLKKRMLEDEVLGDMGFSGARITMEVSPNEPPDEREERLAAEQASILANTKPKTPMSIAGALF